MIFAFRGQPPRKQPNPELMKKIFGRGRGPSEALRKKVTPAAAVAHEDYLRGFGFRPHNFRHPELREEYTDAFQREVRDARDARH